MIDEKFVIIAVLLDLIGGSSYAIDTIKGRTKPNRVTWFLWIILGIPALVGMVDEHASRSAIIFMISLSIIPILIFIASFINKNSFWKITKFDLVCGALSLCGIIAWLITSEGNLAILFALVADFLALLPTMIKGLRAPDTESWLLYFNGILAGVITLFTIADYSFASLAYTIYLTVVCLIMFVIVRFKIGPKLINNPAK